MFLSAFSLLGASTRQDPLLALAAKEVATYTGDFLYSVFGLLVQSDGSFYVSDKLDFKVKHIDAKGKLIGEVGKKGRGRGEFVGPYIIVGGKQGIAVADLQSPRAQLFTYDLKFLNEIFAPGPIMDMRFDSDDNLWIAVLTYTNSGALFKFSADASILTQIHLKNTTNYPFDNLFNFTVTPDGNLRALYACQNILETWTPLGRLVDERLVPGFPPRSRPGGKQQSAEVSYPYGTIPEGNIFFGVCSDSRGSLYILGHDYAANPQRDLFVLNATGELTGILVLPKPSDLIHIDSNDNLWSIEDHRMRVTKYKIVQAETQKSKR